MFTFFGPTRVELNIVKTTPGTGSNKVSPSSSITKFVSISFRN